MFRSGKYRLAWWFFNRPILPFALQLVIVAPLILAADPTTAAGGYAFALPWLLPIVAILNLPFVLGAFRAFRLDKATRRNHALEHATIRYLEAVSHKRFSGQAARNGFRIVGPASVKEIKAAFERVRLVIRSGGELDFVSRRCGSNDVSALGLSLSLLFVLALATVALRPPLAVRATALTATVLLFLGLRHGIGNAIQRRFFMATDFAEVSLRDVRSGSQRGRDRGSVHFVETIVRPRSVARPDAAPPTMAGTAPRAHSGQRRVSR